MILTLNRDYFLKGVIQLMFVMVKCGVLFEVRIEFLNSIWRNFGLKGLTYFCTCKATKLKAPKTYIQLSVSRRQLTNHLQLDM
jgi:hypothetical protein